MLKTFFALLAVASAAAMPLPGQGDAPVAKTSRTPTWIVLEPCEIDGASPGDKVKALCATHEVFEDRALKRGRRIAIKIVVFPATGRDKLPDPLFYIPGGPGSSATEDAPYVEKELAKIREHRDLVFVDQRGTGGSNPLNCTFFDPNDPQSYLGHWNPPDQVRQCRKELETRADLRLYTTSIAMDDLDEIRAGLGYGKINVIGGSYGTRATQEYVRRHGAHVRSIILHGISLTGQFMPRDFPQDTERAINGVLDECTRDASCRAAFPDPHADKQAVLDRLLRGAVEVAVAVSPPTAGGSNSQPTSLRLTRDLAAEAVRYMLYQTSGGSRLPLFLHLAASGNYAPLAQAALFYRQNIVATGATGMYLSVTCAEDLPQIAPGVGERNALNTFLGDYRLRQQREDCTLWPRGSVGRDYKLPVRSNVPALLITGEWDPVTPPVYAETAAKYMPNGLAIIVPSGGHGFNGLENLDCIDNLIAEFVDRGSAKGLDTSCVKTIHRTGFQLKLDAQPT